MGRFSEGPSPRPKGPADHEQHDEQLFRHQRRIKSSPPGHQLRKCPLENGSSNGSSMARFEGTFPLAPKRDRRTRAPSKETSLPRTKTL